LQDIGELDGVRAPDSDTRMLEWRRDIAQHVGLCAPIRHLTRDGWNVEVKAKTWAEILLFLSKCGWQPSVPTYHLLGDMNVNTEDALALAAAGRIVLEETMKDPLGACQTVTFDLGKFAEIVEFASEGEFKITTQVPIDGYTYER